MKIMEKMESILLIDDAADTLEILERNLSSQGYKISTANSAEQGVKFLETYSFDLVITDYKMPRISGMDIIQHVRENYKDTEIMMITGYATIESAINAMKAGAVEYLAKPFTNEELFSAVERVMEKHALQKNEKIRTTVQAHAFEGIIYRSSAMQNVVESIHQFASTDVTVLVSGESGTGKELITRAIHYASPRVSFPFVPVNCGAIPESLLESELFGHTKGAFTGAEYSRAGFFQTADKGTIFLDEIGETSPSMQVKLLRVLQDKEITMVGSSKPFKVDVRIIAATNKDLHALIQKGQFREDLFYRLNVITLELPPLQDRESDVILLAHYFLDKFSGELDKIKLRFSTRVLEILKGYSWPGNVRELENVIHRMVIMTKSNVIDVPDLPQFMHYSVKNSNSPLRTIEAVEKEHIVSVLSLVNQNKTRAAEILGIDRKTLRLKLDKYSKTGS